MTSSSALHLLTIGRLLGVQFGGNLFGIISTSAAPAAAPVRPDDAQEVLPYDLVMPALYNVSGPSWDDPTLSDILRGSTCWVGDFTADACCRAHNPQCWDEHMTYNECCPNADCWEGGYNYETCCMVNGGTGNPGCWGDVYTHARCCALTEPSTTWVDNLFVNLGTESFYSFDEFYNDAQYGEDFGYYSTGRVMGAGKAAPDAREKDNAEKGLPAETKFQIVEMGAGSGQLGQDIRDCVLENCLKLSPGLAARWKNVFKYTILERSPALATRQRERGLEVVVSDAQTVNACEVLKSKAIPPPGSDTFYTDVVISNELIDAFAPIKLKLSVFDLENINYQSCSSWTEMKLLHLIKKSDVLGLFAHQLGLKEPQLIVSELEEFTQSFFCAAASTSVGKAAMAILPQNIRVANDNTTCMNMVLGLSDLMETSNLQIPAASNNVRLRLRKDGIVQGNLRQKVRQTEKDLNGYLAIPRGTYQTLRKALKDRGRQHENLDVTFMIATKTRRLSVPITQTRCREQHIGTFLKRHGARTKRLAKFYHDLGYPSLYVLMRPGEEEFIRLTECLLNKKKGGHVLTIDYGASFEPLANSLSVDPLYDGIFVPPIPHHLMEDLPHCHGDWTVCAGRIDWTTFVDFTNMAAAGNDIGYETIWYGPQSFLEQMSSTDVTQSLPPNATALPGAFDHAENALTGGNLPSEIIPGYSMADNVNWVGRHTINWFGPEKAEPWQQRWTGFKALLQRVPPVPEKPAEENSRLPAGIEPETILTRNPDPILGKNDDRFEIVKSPTWHLDVLEKDQCWVYDPTNMPIADWSRINSNATNATTRQVLSVLSVDVDKELGIRYAMGYEYAQLAVRLVDFMVASVGCIALANPDSIALKWKERDGRLTWIRERWSTIWNDAALDLVLPAVLKILRAEAVSEQKTIHYPYECLARQTLRILCPNALV